MLARRADDGRSNQLLVHDCNNLSLAGAMSSMASAVSGIVVVCLVMLCPAGIPRAYVACVADACLRAGGADGFLTG